MSKHIEFKAERRRAAASSPSRPAPVQGRRRGRDPGMARHQSPRSKAKVDRFRE